LQRQKKNVRKKNFGLDKNSSSNFAVKSWVTSETNWNIREQSSKHEHSVTLVPRKITLPESQIDGNTFQFFWRATNVRIVLGYKSKRTFIYHLILTLNNYYMHHCCFWNNISLYSLHEHRSILLDSIRVKAFRLKIVFECKGVKNFDIQFFKRLLSYSTFTSSISHIL
jgi:hypothetical protein